MPWNDSLYNLKIIFQNRAQTNKVRRSYQKHLVDEAVSNQIIEYQNNK